MPARGYPPCINQLILDKIHYAKGYDPSSYDGHRHLNTIFGFWLRQSKEWRQRHANVSPNKELWEGTLNSTDIYHINIVLSRDFASAPTFHPSPTWCITTIEPLNRDGKNFISSTALKDEEAQLIGDQGKPGVAEDPDSDPLQSQSSHLAIRTDSAGADSEYSIPPWWTDVEPS